MAQANSARRTAFTRGDSGFTLIELLITIVITAVIAGIALPSIAQAAMSQSDTTAQVAAKTIALAESSVFSVQRSYVTVDNLQARKMINGVDNSTVLLGPNAICYTAVAVSKNGVAYIAETGLASVKLTPSVTSSCAIETDLRAAVVSLGGSITGRTSVTSVSPVASISYVNGSLSWPAVTGATYLVQRYNGSSWITVQQSAALTFPALAPSTGTSVRYQVTAVIGPNSSTARQYLLTNDVPRSLIASGDLSSSAIGWTLIGGAYYSNMTAGTPGYINLPTYASAVQIAPLPTPGTVYLYGAFSATAGITVQFDFFAAGADPATATPVATTSFPGDSVATGTPVTVPATAAKARITVTNNDYLAANFQALTLQ